MIKPNIRIGYEDGFGEMALVKPFSIEGRPCWIDGTEKRTRGVLRIYPLYRQIEVELFSGAHPDVQDLLQFLLRDKDVKELICEYQKKGRKIPYAMQYVKKGTVCQGSQDVYICFTDKSGLIKTRKHLLHISCYDKIAGIKRMYIGDFAEMVATIAVKKEQYAWTCNETTGRYEKPYFVKPEEVKTKVSRLYR